MINLLFHFVECEMDDDDADGDKILPTHTACDCKETHTTKLLNCIGCGRCYLHFLKNCTDDDEGDYEDEEDMIYHQPDHGVGIVIVLIKGLPPLLILLDRGLVLRSS